jgi:hypothetical protein
MIMLAIVAVLALTILGMIGLFRSPVEADGTPDGVCDEGEFCLFENNDYNEGNVDHVYEWYPEAEDDDFGDNAWYNTDDVLEDEASSVWNRTPCHIVLYQDDAWQGDADIFEPGQSDGYLENNAVGDNSASSFEISHDANCPA